MATRSTARYTKHRQRAAVRRRRIVLLLVLATALVVVGGAMAWPRGEDPTSSQVAVVPAKAKANDKANADAQQPAEQTETTDAAAAAAGDGADGGGVPVDPSQILPDWEPSPQAKAAIATALANGRPPQFIVSSFDGAADYRMYQRWLKVADDVGARFTFFVSGIYMLLPEKKDVYQPPQAPRGFSNLGGYAELAGPKSAAENLVDNVADFNTARALGHEIGSHYVSHLCEQSDAWSSAEWVSEQSQWEQFMLDPAGVNGLSNIPTPIYTKQDFHGGRTPCLSGNKPLLYDAMKQVGFEYDASQAGILGAWPTKQQGLWNFALPSIKRVGSKYDTMAMDYNFYVNHGQAETQAQADEFEQTTYQSYMNAINSLYRGNRAPYITGSHFANWNKGAYMNALERTLRDACTRPETACVNFITLARWLDEQTPAQLAKWNAGTFKQS